MCAWGVTLLGGRNHGLRGKEATGTLSAMEFAVLKQAADSCHQLAVHLQVLREDSLACTSTYYVPDVILASHS